MPGHYQVLVDFENLYYSLIEHYNTVPRMNDVIAFIHCCLGPVDMALCYADFRYWQTRPQWTRLHGIGDRLRPVQVDARVGRRVIRNCVDDSIVRMLQRLICWPGQHDREDQPGLVLITGDGGLYQRVDALARRAGWPLNVIAVKPSASARIKRLPGVIYYDTDIAGLAPPGRHAAAGRLSAPGPRPDGGRAPGSCRGSAARGGPAPA